jgi:RNA polymerase sigma-70 factor (ECF subfamily)
MTTIEFSTELFRYDQVLRPFAYNLVKSKEESEDLIQDTFYRALANKDKFMEGTNIKAWLFTIMKNIFINNYRKNQKKNTITDTSDNQYLLNSTRKTLSNDGESTLLKEVIDHAIEDVSSEFTEPFMMYYTGFKYQEIATKLDLPLGTVKSRIFFARKEIQSRLKAMGIEHSQN